MKTLFILSFLTIVTVKIFAQQCDWQPVGPDDFNQLYHTELKTVNSRVYQSNIHLDNQGIPYVYCNNQVKRYNNNKWEIVGGDLKNIPSNVGLDNLYNGMVLSYALDRKNSIPYILYKDYNTSQASVQKFDGTHWVLVGNKKFSSPITSNTEWGIAIDKNGIPYVAGFGGGLIAWKLIGNTWTQVGGTIFSLSNSYYYGFDGMRFDQTGNPLVCYLNSDGGGQNLRYTVAKFDGTKWTKMGSDIAYFGYSTDLEVDGNGIPYIGFFAKDSTKVFRYESGDWKQIGNKILSGGEYNSTILLGFDKNNVPYLNSDGIFKFDGANWIKIINSPPGYKSNKDVLGFDLDNNGVPYVVYNDDIYKRGNARKYEAGKWTSLGEIDSYFGANIFIQVYNYVQIKLNTDANGVVYMLYNDSSAGNKATVRKFNGSYWEIVGKKGFSSGAINYQAGTLFDMGILFDKNNMPYVYFTEDTLSASVMKFNGTSWDYVGIKAFSGPGKKAYQLNVAINKSTGNLWAVYEEVDKSSSSPPGYARIRKFNGINWVPVNEMGIWVGNHFPKIVVNNSDVPYVWFNYNGYAVAVMKYDGTQWAFINRNDTVKQVVKPLKVIIAENDIPYIFYVNNSNVNNGTNISVTKYTGTGLERIAPIKKMGTSSPYYFLLDNNNNPYVCRYLGVPDYFNIDKYDGSQWTTQCDTFVTYPFMLYFQYQNTTANIDFTISNDKVVVGYTNYMGNFVKQFNGIIGVPTNTFETEKSEKIALFPNPVSGQLFVSGLSNKKKSITVYSILGEKAIQLTLTEVNQTTIDVSALSSGIYFIEVRDEENNVTVKKFVKE